MNRYSLTSLLAGLALMTSSEASAAITWADWTSVNNPSGQTAAPDDSAVASFGALGVSVTYVGDIYAAQINGGGTNYWSIFPAADKPGTTDIVEIRGGGTKTITFSKSVTDVYLALVSWNNNRAEFDHSFTITAQGLGYFGQGSFISNPSTPRTVLRTAGATNEFHGVLKFSGPITSLTFTDGAELWHGFSIGIGSVTPVVDPVPEISSWAMMIAGFAMIGRLMRRRVSMAFS